MRTTIEYKNKKVQELINKAIEQYGWTTYSKDTYIFINEESDYIDKASISAIKMEDNKLTFGKLEVQLDEEFTKEHEFQLTFEDVWNIPWTDNHTFKVDTVLHTIEDDNEIIERLT